MSAAVKDAASIARHALPTAAPKRRLCVENADPDRAVAELRDILSDYGEIYDRGVPVVVTYDQTQKGMVVQPLNADALVLITHQICRPYSRKEVKGEVIEKDVRFPLAIGRMYLAWRGNWCLPPLNGIGAAPLLREGGAIRSGEGYDPETGIWSEKVPDLDGMVPDCPTRDGSGFPALDTRAVPHFLLRRRRHGDDQ